MQINLPDHLELDSKADAGGFTTVEEYLLHLVQDDVGPFEQIEVNGDQLSADDWQERFECLLRSVEPGNPDFDDSRESIYPVR